MHYLTAFALLLATALASADTTITYQGQLQDGSGPVNGTPEMEFRLYDSLDGTTQVGSTVVHGAVPVTDGLFRVELDFGPVFDGTGLFLEVTVEGQPLSPRQALTAAPMAQFAMTGAWPFELIGDDAVYLQGNVGIGTSSPSVALEVEGSAMFGSANQINSVLSFVGGGSGNAANANYSVVSGGFFNTASGLYSFVGGGSDNSAIGSLSTVAGGALNTASGFSSFAAGRQAKAEHHGTFVWADNNDVDFASTGEDQFLIRAQNGVGINTNSPANSLTVAGDADFSGSVGIGTNSPGAALDVFGSAKFGQSNEATGLLSFVGGGTSNVASGDYSFAAGRRARAIHDHTFVWSDSRFGDIFASTDERQFLIRAHGGVGINVNEPLRSGLHFKQQSRSPSEIGLVLERAGASTNNWAFYVAGSNNLGFRYNDNLVARIDTSGAFATLSDASYKTDVEPLAGALERVMRLEPASYRMTMGSEDDPVSLGLIAQQVSQVLPGAVSEEEGTLGVYYNQITALNTAALIELNTRTLASSQQQRSAIEAQQAIIQAQQARIAELEEHQDTQIAELQARLASLEALLLAEERQLVEQHR